MNPSGYAILIFAILLVVGAMLYARFFARSRKKSLDHPADVTDAELMEGVSSPVDGAEAGEISSHAKPADRHVFVLPPESSETENGIEPSGFHSETTESAKAADVPDLVAKPNQRKESREADYFDDLQDAAAGLAMLMRSSPANRTSPVIFAPEETEEIDEDAPGNIVLPLADASGHDETEQMPQVAPEADESISVSDDGSPENVAEVPSLESPENEGSVESAEVPLADIDNLFDDSIELVTSEGADGVDDLGPEGESEVATASSSYPSSGKLRLLLGDEVGDQVDTIDQGLSELEALVVSIESSLASLDLTIFEEDDVVSKAA